jgi:hypothetical protein
LTLSHAFFIVFLSLRLTFPGNINLIPHLYSTCPQQFPVGPTKPEKRLPRQQQAQAGDFLRKKNYENSAEAPELRK